MYHSRKYLHTSIKLPKNAPFRYIFYLAYVLPVTSLFVESSSDLFDLWKTKSVHSKIWLSIDISRVNFAQTKGCHYYRTWYLYTKEYAATYLLSLIGSILSFSFKKKKVKPSLSPFSLYKLSLFSCLYHSNAQKRPFFWFFIDKACDKKEKKKIKVQWK